MAASVQKFARVYRHTQKWRFTKFTGGKLIKIGVHALFVF